MKQKTFRPPEYYSKRRRELALDKGKSDVYTWGILVLWMMLDYLFNWNW